jgi:hypothetical protein
MLTNLAIRHAHVVCDVILTRSEYWRSTGAAQRVAVLNGVLQQAIQGHFLSLLLACHRVELGMVEPRIGPHTVPPSNLLRSPPRTKTSSAQTTRREAAGGKANLYHWRRVGGSYPIDRMMGHFSVRT